MFFVGANKIASQPYKSKRLSFIQHLCTMTLSNLRDCQLSSAFDVKVVGQHDWGLQDAFYQRNI